MLGEYCSKNRTPSSIGSTEPAVFPHPKVLWEGVGGGSGGAQLWGLGLVRVRFEGARRGCSWMATCMFGVGPISCADSDRVCSVVQ
eukprot:934424-Rhodomonas_salina.1